jgi:hypothetical protein
LYPTAKARGSRTSGAPDPRWSNDDLGMLKTIKGSNFEVVRMGTIVTR